MVNNNGKEKERILKNTVMLYIRMAVIMLVTLYITRVVLNALGEEDYGIYNIVGSVVVSLVFVQNTLVSATQRFLSYEIGRKDRNQISDVFSMSINIHMLFILVILILLETVGLWFLNNVISLPANRINAANIAYQLSVVTFVINVFRIPYNAVIISFEKMDVYALLSILEALLKLSIAYALLVLSYDKLVLYAILMFVVTIIINLSYIYYCKNKYSQVCHYAFKKDKIMFKEMVGFSGWNMVGGLTGIATNEAPNYLMNIFLGVRINAAMGIAKQVSSAVYQFTSNFQTAFNPQVVKVYASNEKKSLISLVKETSIISFYLMLIFALPIILCAKTIFDIWLVEVPEYAVDFSILMMVAQLMSAISSPLWMLAHAIGHIKRYQLTLSVINLSVLPLSWVLLYLNLNVINVVALQILINFIVIVYRISYLRNTIDFPMWEYYRDVILRCILCLAIIIPFPLYLSLCSSGIFQIAVVFPSSIFISIFVFLFVGINRSTRTTVLQFLCKKIKK